MTLRSRHAQACISLVDLSKSIKAFSQIKSGVFTLTEGFFPRELIFINERHSAKFGKFRTREVFVLNGSFEMSLIEERTISNV